MYICNHTYINTYMNIKMQDNTSPAHKFIETFKGEFLVEPKTVTKTAAGC